MTFAVYTRKSTEKGLDSIFNSLSAQREICEEFIASHQDDGWVVSPVRYDDGGYSGGTEKRPAFQRLLADISAGLVGGVVVYKLDRLHRETGDGDRFLKSCRKLGVQVVSPTESTAMETAADRLGLTMRLGVNQFMREQTAERIRDKIRASRKRGMWTGGAVPLGYCSVDKRLVIDEAAAQTARDIVAVYLETGSLIATLEILRERGIVAKGGAPFTVATLRNLLHSPLIGGRINAGDKVVKAEHEAILDEPTWEALQAKLAQPEKPVPRHRRSRSEALLANLVRCGRCEATWSYQWTGKGKRRYGFYVCQSIIRKGAKACPGSRAPAGQMEAAVVERIMAIGRDPTLVTEALAAARTELDARGPALADEVRKLNEERRRLTGERTNIVDAIAADGGAPALTQKLAELDTALEQLATRLREAKTECAALKRIEIDEADLRAALASFTPVWDALFPKERARILSLLIEIIRVNVPTGDVEIVFRPGGVRLLAIKEKEVSA